MSQEWLQNHRSATRRDVLKITGGSLLVPVVSTGTAGDEATSRLTGVDLQHRASVQRPPETGYLSYPSDPFMIGQFATPYLKGTEYQGWQTTSLRKKIRTLLSLHLDVLDAPSLAVFEDGNILEDSETSTELSSSYRASLPATAGMNTSITLDMQMAYDPVLEAEKWSFPNGERVDSVPETFAKTFDGQDQQIEFTFTTNGITSVFAPLGLHLLIEVTKHRLAQGFTGFFVDKVFNYDGLDFSRWAIAAFQSHLEELSASRLDALGIDDPSTFNIKTYLKDNDLTPASGADPRTDPVFSEYVLHNHLGIKQFLEEYRAAVAEAFPDRHAAGDIAIWANQFMGSLTNHQAPNVYLSDHLDIINTEHFPRVNPSSAHVYKLLEAIGRFEKPVQAKATLAEVSGSDRFPDLNPEEEYPMLERFQVAEAYASGSRLKLPLTPRGAYTTDESITQWIRADGSVPAELRAMSDFVWAHKRYLSESEPANDVAVIWSLSDSMYRKLPQWDIQPRRWVDTFLGTTTLLREAQVPYSILVFGHPALWDDTTQRERLHEHEAVILPDIRALTDAQVSALRSFVEDGGTLVTSGDRPDRDELYLPKDNFSGLFDHQNTVTLTDNPGLQRHREGASDGALIQTLQETGIEPYVPNAGPTLSVNCRSQPAESRTIVHLLNYEYTPETDSFARKEDITLRLPAPEHDVGVARYYTPDGGGELDITELNEKIEIKVPQLREWGFVVLAESTTDLADTSIRKEAEQATDEAREHVMALEDEGEDWSPTFAIADTKLEAAETALEYDAYRQANEAAQEALVAAENTPSERPVVGIDMAHGQAASFDDPDPYASLRANFQYPDYRILDSWDEDPLEELDVLVVPPALTFNGGRFGFSNEELDRIESFVANGGSLAMMARGGVDAGVNDLASRFGYSFSREGIKYPPNARPTVATTKEQHELTWAVPEVRAEWATWLVNTPDDATVLAAIPDDSTAWVHKGPPIDEQTEDEPDAPPAPIYAVSQYQAGTVVALGTWSYLLNPGVAHWIPMVDTLLSTLSERAIEAKSSTSESPTQTQTATTTPPTTESESPTQTQTATTTPPTTESQTATTTPPTTESQTATTTSDQTQASVTGTEGMTTTDTTSSAATSDTTESQRTVGGGGAGLTGLTALLGGGIAVGARRVFGGDDTEDRDGDDA